jgi:hypothetical protein
MKDRFPRLYLIVMMGGTTAGAIFGDHIFLEEATALGFPLADILFALLGALLAAIGWEIVANIRNLP